MVCRLEINFVIVQPFVLIARRQERRHEYCHVECQFDRSEDYVRRI